MENSATVEEQVRGHEVLIRQAEPADVAVCGQICFEAFKTISQKHGFPCELPDEETATRVISSMFGNPRFYCVVAEINGAIVGSNCLDERSAIAGVGPITIDPRTQDRGVGRKLMTAVIERARMREAPGIRLVQAAYHSRSLSLYTKLGFDIREPLALMQGLISASVDGCVVRTATLSDVESCDRLCKRVHGHDRHYELLDGIEAGRSIVVERSGRITGYASQLAFFGYAVAESNLDMQALIGSNRPFGGAGILVPTRNASLFRSCLDAGLRVVEPMTLMSQGLYNEPSGAWLPSISF
ncbi:MAG: GNAT family N-acetyltransferase [Acidobacteriaceae bacterium]|nr:GNAT family N-acetyltransferase [Acidobacteriaceae bacterium]